MKKAISMVVSAALVCVTCVGTALVSGCATEYKLGSTLSADLCDVYVPTVRNESDQPDAARYLTSALTKEIRRDGTLRLVPESEASTRLEVTVTEYDQESISYDRDSTQTPNRYRMYLKARVAFVRIARPKAGRTEEQVIWKRDSVIGDETYDGGSDSLAFKLACLPQVAENLAETIVDACISAW